MDNLSVNTTQAVQMPISIEAPTAQTPPTPVVRTDTIQTDEATKKDTNVDMEQLTQKLNDIAQDENLDISFGYNKKIDRVTINITDKNSGEIIRKLPSEEAVKFAEGMQDIIGKLFDKKG